MTSIRQTISLLLLSISIFASSAQTLNHDEGVAHWELGFHAGLNNDGYEAEVRALYFPIQYIGVKVGLGAAGEVEEFEDWGKEEWEKYNDYAVRFKFNPAIVFRSPRLFSWKSQGAGIYLFTEPGIIISPGASGSRHARCFRWNVQSGINIQIDRFIFTIGYGISNFSLLSGAPWNHNGLPVNTDYITHSGFIGGAVKF